MNEVELIPIKQDNEIIGYEVDNVATYMKSIGKSEKWKSGSLDKREQLLRGSLLSIKPM